MSASEIETGIYGINRYDIDRDFASKKPLYYLKYIEPSTSKLLNGLVPDVTECMELVPV